jgi:hypothetical protein
VLLDCLLPNLLTLLQPTLELCYLLLAGNQFVPELLLLLLVRQLTLCLALLPETLSLESCTTSTGLCFTSRDGAAVRVRLPTRVGGLARWFSSGTTLSVALRVVDCRDSGTAPRGTSSGVVRSSGAICDCRRVRGCQAGSGVHAGGIGSKAQANPVKLAYVGPAR